MSKSNATSKTSAPKVRLDPEELTLNELEQFEDALHDTGVDFDSAFAKGGRRAPAMRIIAWLILKRDNPDMTLEEAGDVKLGQFELDDDDEPAEGKG